MPLNSKGIISLIIVNDVDKITIAESGIKVDSIIEYSERGYYCDGANFKISTSLGQSVLVSLIE